MSRLRRTRASDSLRTASDRASTPAVSCRSDRRGSPALQVGASSASLRRERPTLQSRGRPASRVGEFPAFEANAHPAPQTGNSSASLASGRGRSLSHASGIPSDQSCSSDGPASPTSDISVSANQGSTRADHGSPYAAHLSLPADLYEHDPLAGEARRWREGVFGRRVQSLGIGAVRGLAVRAARSLGARAVKDAVLALLRHTLTLAKQRSLSSIDSSGTRALHAEGEPMFGGEPPDVYARECLAPVASTPSLSSELRDWVAWYRAGLLGSSSDLGEGADGFDGHSGAQDDHAGVLGESMGVLDDGTGVLDDHTGAPGDRTDALNDRTDEHTAAGDDFPGALDDDNSSLDEYTDALEDHTGDLVNDTITQILRFNDEAIRKARISLGIYPSFNRAGERPSSAAGESPSSAAGENPKSSAGERPSSWVGESSSGQKGEVSSSGVGESTSSSVTSGPAKETGSLPDPSWGVWRREAWYVAEGEGPSNGRRETSARSDDPSSSTKRELGPSTSKYEPGPSTSTRELGNSMPKNENLTPSPDSLNGGTPASHAPPSPVFDSPETFSTRRTTPSPTKVALPHASPTARRPSPTARRPSPSVRRPSPRRPSSLEPPPFSTSNATKLPPLSTRPQRSSPPGIATSHQGDETSHQTSDGQRSIAEELICRRWSSPPYLRSSTSTPPHPGPPPSISVRHSSLSRANIRNVLDALPALSRGRSVPPRATISNATAPNATTLNATNPNAPTSNRATSSGAEAYIYPSAHATTPSYPVLSSSRPTSTSKPADAERSQARDFEILLSPPSSLRALPSLALGDVPPADQLTFQLSQVPLGVQTTLRDAEHLAQAAKERWSSSTSPDDALWRAALDDIARAIHDTRRMLHKYKTTEIKLDKDPKCTDARCYTEGLKGMMGTCAAFVHRMDRDPRACGCDWLCDVRDHVVAHEARIRSAIHALANHDIQARLADLEELALPMSQER